MKRIAYVIFLAFAAFNFVACDDDNTNDSENVWAYARPYFEFEYATDSVTFGMAGHQTSLAVNDLKRVFLEMASTKMQDYFQGIDFYSADTLLIQARKATGESMEIRANYLKNDQYLEVKLNAEDMAALMGDKAVMIPAISFKYIEKNHQMTIYFDEVYVQSIFENVQIQNMLLPMIARAFNPQFDQMPPQAQQGMLTGLKQQISGILDNIQTLKIGFVLDKLLAE